MSLIDWMKKGRKNGQGRSASARPIQAPAFEQLEPRLLLSADGLMPLVSPLIETQYEYAIVVDLEESWNDSGVRGQGLGVSEEQSDGETVGEFDGQTAEIASNQQLVTSNQSGLSVSELTTAARLSATVQNEILPSPADASEDLTMLHTSDFTLQTLSLDSVQTRGPPTEASTFDSSQNNAFQLENAYQTSLLVSVLSCDTLSISPNFDSSDASSLDDLNLSDSANNQEPALEGVQSLLVSGSFASGAALPQSLTDEAVTPVLEEALRLWSASGLIDDLAGRLAGLEIRITDLPGGQLGQADENVITLDATAAGRGWFIDPTPGEHTEFTESLTESMAASSSSPAFGHIDLLTVLLHEIGHVAGLDHDAGLAVMAETLSHSQRVLLANNFTSSITVLDLVISGASHVTPDLNLSDSSNNGATISIQVNTDGTLNVSGTATGDNGTFSGITNIIGNAAAAITLVSPNLDNVWTLTGINSGTLTAGTLSPISFTNVRNLTGGSSADSFDFQSGGAVTGMIQDGTGTLTVGVAGFVQVSGDYDFVQQSFSGNYSGDVSGTVTGANVLTVGGTSGTGLIGVNAFDNPLGLQGTLSGFGLGVVTDGTHAWHLFQGTIVDPSFVGFGSDLSAGVSNLTVTVNNGSSGTYLNTHPTPISVATGGTAVPLDFTTGVVAASTTFSLTISDFVHLSGIFTFGLGLGTSVDVQTGLNATTGPTVAPALTSLATSDPGSGVWRSTDYSMLYNLSVSAFTIAATDVSVFVGYSSGLTPTGANGTLLSTDVPDDAVGLYASNVDVGLVLMSAKKTGMANFDQLKLSFHALKATASNIEILGIPSLTLSANNVEVRVNSGKAWAGAAATAPRPTVDFVESFTATGYAIQTGGTAISIAFAGPVIGASADNVLFKVSDFVYLSGSLSVNLGLASTVDVRTGLTSTQIAATPTLWTGVPTLASDNGTFGHSSDGSLIYNLPVQSIDIGVSGVDVFVGYTESLTAAAADGEITVAELDAAGAIGVLMDEVDLGMVLMRAAPPVGATYLRNAKLKFIALQGHADLLSLIGVPEVQFDAQGAEVRVNQGKASGPWPSTGAGAVQPVVDFTLSFPDDSWGSTADGDSDPDGYRVATSTSGGVIIPLLFDQQLIAAGAEKVTIGISEFVYLTGSVYVEMGPVISAPMVPGLNNLPPPLATKSIQTMSIGATNVHAFVGFNGPYWVDSASGVNHNGLIDRDGSGNIIAAEVNPDAVGLVIDNLTFGLFLGRPVDKFDTSRYMALKASANSVSLVGIPGLTATANSIQVELNLSTPSVYGLPVLPVINFSGLPGGKFEVKTGAKDGSGDDITVDLNMSTPLIRAQGFVHLNVLDSLYASGSAAFELGPTADVKIKDAVTGLSTTKQVRTLSIGVANANAFIGANGPYWTDTNHNNSVDAGELSSTAIGFSVTDFDAGLLVMSPTGAGQPGPYFGLKASVTSFGLVNMPAGITATGTFDIAINKGPAPTLAVDFVTSFGAPGYVVNTGDATSTVLLDFTAPKIDIKLAGAIAVAGAFDLTGVFFFDMNPGSLKVFADAALAIGPSGDYFAMQAIGVLVINSTGVAADLDVTMSLGTAVSDIALVNPSARVILNTSGIQQTVTIPTKYVSLLSAAAQSRLLTNGSGDKYYAVSAGAPRIDGTFAPAGLYVVVNFSATLRILTFDFVGNFRLVADPSQFQITTDATLNLALNGTDIFRFVVRGDMFINTAGKIAAGIDLEFASGFAFPGNLGFTLSATFKLRLNVSTSPITLPSVGLVEPGFRVIATGTLGIPGLTLTGSFGFTFAPDKFTVNISATANVFGASLGVNGFAGLYYDANPGLAFSIQMTLGGGPNVVVQPVSGVDFTISANFQLVINTSTTARTDLNTGASIAASSFLIGATNVSVNLFGFVLAGDLTIAISSAGLSIPNFSLVLDFFGAFNLNVSGSLGTNGSFSFTASAVITFLDPAVFGFTGTVSVTFSNSGFSGSVSATFGAFGIQVHGDGVFTIEIPSLRVCLSVNISLQITPAFHVHIPLPWPLDDIHFDVPALIISGTWANCFGTLTSAPAIPPPPALATMIGNQLRLNIGVDVGARGSFYPATDESYNLTLVGAGSSTGQKIKVSALGYEQIYDNVTSIIANDTGSGTTFISITPDITVPVSINAGVTVSGSNHFILGGGFATVQGGSNFDWIDAGPGGGTFYGGTGDSKVIDDYGNLTVQVAGYESYTVSDTSLRYQTGTDAKTMTLGGAVGVGHINLYGTNAAFTVAPSWTHQGLSLYGAGASSSVTGTTSNHYTLTNASLTNGAGVTVSLSGISTASLSGYNHFDVSGWTGSGAINGFGGSDRVIASNNANFTLTNTSLARTSGGSFSLTGIELADLTGGASQNTFTVSSWTGTANLNGQGAADIYSVSLVGSGAGTANITDTGGTAGDTLTVNGTAGNDVFTISGTQVVLGAETVNYANLEALTINGLGGNDTFTVNSTSVPTTINGGNNDDTFYVNASSASITLNGENQDDTFYVRALTASALINTGTGTNVVHVGSAALPAAGHVNAVTGKVTINGGGSDTLNVNDTSDTGTNIGQLTSTRLTGLGMGDSSKGIQYTSIEALNISLGSGPDDFTIFSTHAGVTVLNTLGDDDRIAINATSGSTTVNTGDGNDTIHVGSAATVTANSGGTLNAILGALAIHGQGGSSDTVTLDDTADTAVNTGTLTSSLLTGLGTHGVTYTGFETFNLNLGSGGDTLNVQSTLASTLTTLNTGSGSSANTVNLGSNAPATVNAIAGKVIVNGQSSADTINVYDTGDAATNSGVLTGTRLTGLGMGDATQGLEYDAIETLNINLGSGDDTFFIASTHTGLTTLQAGPGHDKIYLATIAGETWIRGEAGDDTIKVNVNDDGTERIVGGVTANGVGAYLDLDGGLGSDDYRVYFAGSPVSASHPVSLINVHDTGGNGNGTDFLEIFGTDDANVTDNFLVRRNFIALVPPTAVGTAGTAERINYDDTLNAGIAIYARAGDDYFAFDDTSAAMTVDGGDGADTFQIGQMFQSERVSTPIVLADTTTAPNGTVAPGDEVTTVHTTRGYLTPGVQAPTTIYGGDGNDQFIIFSNQGPLGLFGEDGDDRFVVRAFALYGSQAVDPNRANTNITAGEGADNVEYSVNAPVAIDGGDGRDTIVVVGTEFSDHIVVTSKGIYGAGLFITYIGIEEIEVHAAEGNDHISIQGTPTGVVTRIFGDLGSDTFDVGGQAGTVVSRDLQGHSGIIDNVIVSDDVTYTGIPVEGVAVDVADNDAPGVVITESGGRTIVAESDYGIGLQIDSYTVVLTAAPLDGRDIYLTVSAPVSSLKDQTAGSSSVQVYTNAANAPAAYTTPGRAIELHFTAANWNQPQTVFVQAVNDAAPEGSRYAFIQHSISKTSSEGYGGLALPNVAAEILDDEVASAVLLPVAGDSLTSERIGTVNPILEGNTTVSFQSFALIVTQGAANVTVDGGSQLTVVGPSSFSFTAGSSAQLVTLRGLDDGLVEGPHRGVVTATVTSGAAESDQVEVPLADTNSPGVVILPTYGSTRVIEGSGTGVPWTDAYSVVLTKAPAAGTTVQVQVTALPTPTTNAQLLGLAGGIVPQVAVGTLILTFTDANWSTPQSVTVTAIDDTVADGGDIQAFARTIQTVDGIRGPLLIEGGIDPTFDSRLPEPRLYFGETNLQQHINLPNPNFSVLEPDQVDSLRVYNNDAVAAQTGTLTQTRLFGLGMGSDLTVFSAAANAYVTIGGGITYSNLETLSLYLGSGVDQFEVQSTHAGDTLIDAGPGSDIVTVRTVLGHTTILGNEGDDQISLGTPGASQLTIDRLAALVTIDGGAGSDTVNINDSGDTNDNVVLIDNTTVTGGDMFETRVRTLEVSAAAAGTFTITIDGHSASLSIKATAAELRTVLMGFGLPGVNDIVVDRSGEIFTLGFLVDETLPASALLLSAGGSYVATGTSVTNRLQTIALPAASGSYTVTLGTGLSAPTFSVTVGDSADTVRTKILDAINPGFSTGTGKLSTEPGGYGRKDVKVTQYGTTYEVLFQGLLSGSRGDLFTLSVAPRSTAAATTFSINAIGGTFRLNFAGSTLQTSPLAWNASAAEVQTVLRGILGDSILTVSQTGSTYAVTDSPAALSAVDDRNLVAPIAVALRNTGVNYYGVDTLNVHLGSGSDVLNIRGTTAITNVSTSDGDDRIYVSSLASETLISAATTDFLAGNLDRILGTLNLDAGDGRQLLMISDEAAIAGDGTTANPVLITDQAVSGLGLPATEITITGLTPAPAMTVQAAATGNFADGITIWTGWGNDTIVVHGTHQRGDGLVGSMRTATTLNTGLGNDDVIVDLNSADGFFVLNTQGPENDYVGLLSDSDTVTASSSTRALLIFGGQDNDTISGGQAADIIFADRGLVTYYDGNTAVAVFGHGGPGDLTDGVERSLGFVTTTFSGVGGDDTVFGLEGRDLIFGGFGSDHLDASASDVADDILVGDNGQALFTAGIITQVDTTATDLGGNDTLTAGKGANIAFGGFGNDTIFAGGDNLSDILVGDNGTAIFDPANGRLLEIFTTASADAGTDELTTGDGSSVVFGGSFSDLITSGAGNDILVGDNGRAVFDALTYRLIFITTTVPQQPTGAGRVVDGVTYDDVINAGQGDNVIFGGSFNDHVVALDGNDIVVGDNGDAAFDATGILRIIETSDPTFGGDDQIDSGIGPDVVFGGSGADTIDSGSVLAGDISRDIVVGDNGRGEFDAAGFLVLVFTTVPDTGANDTILIGAGDNVAFGGVGDDEITAGSGHDIIVGDNGSATFHAVTLAVANVQTSDPAFGGMDTLEAGDGNNIVLGGSAGDEITTGTGDDIVLGDNGYVDYVVRDGSTADIDMIASTDVTDGGVDHIITDDGSDIIIGGQAGDTIDAGNGHNLVIGDNGQITAAVEDANRLATQAITLGLIETTAFGIGGDDHITTGSGNDVVLGGHDADTIDAGHGDNVVLGDDGAIDYVRFERDGAAPGADTDASDIDLITSLSTNAAGGADDITTGSGFDIVIGGRFGDTIHAGDGANIVMGDSARITAADVNAPRLGSAPLALITLMHLETLTPGDGGNDRITTGDGNDLVIGGTGDDDIRGGAGSDILLGDHGLVDYSRPANQIFLAIFTGAAHGGGHDTIDGGPGDDFILGQQGDDTIYGGQGQDDITGGHNVVGGSDGHDTIYGGDQPATPNSDISQEEYVTPGDGADVILGDNGIITRIVTSVFVPGVPPTQWQTYPAPFADVIRTVVLFDDVDLIQGNDRIYGDAGQDILFGQRGNDEVNGGADDDEVIGGLGSDTVAGGSGNDFLLGDVGQIVRAFNPDGTPLRDANGSWHRDAILEDIGVITGVIDLDVTPLRYLDPTLATRLLEADMLLLGGSYLPGGARQLNSDTGAWATKVYLIDMVDADNDIINGGDGEDLIFGQRGNDVLNGDAGNDSLFGDGFTNTVPFLTNLPQVVNGIRIIGQTPGANVPVLLPFGGALVIPNLTLRPEEFTAFVPELTFVPATVPAFAQAAAQDNLIGTDGSAFVVFASVIPDVVHHIGMLPGNDQLNGGSGDDLLVGDTANFYSPLFTGLKDIEFLTTDVQADIFWLLRGLHFLSLDEQQLALDRGQSTGDQAISLGNDELNGGDGNDTLIGDNMQMVAPFMLGLPVAETDFQSAALEYQQFLFDLRHAIVDLSSMVTEAHVQVLQGMVADLPITNPRGVDITYKNAIDPHIHTYAFGNDTLDGGNGNDTLIGDDVSYFAPVINVTDDDDSVYSVYGPISKYTLKAVDRALDDAAHTDNDALKLHMATNHPDPSNRLPSDKLLEHIAWDWEYSLSTGNDTIHGGPGDDLIVGDYAGIVTPVVLSLPSHGKHGKYDWRYWNDDFEDVFQYGLGKDYFKDYSQYTHDHGDKYHPVFWPEDLDHNVFHRGSGKAVREVNAGNDILFGDEGNDDIVGDNLGLVVGFVANDSGTSFTSTPFDYGKASHSKDYWNFFSSKHHFRNFGLFFGDYYDGHGYSMNRWGHYKITGQQSRDTINGGPDNDLLVGDKKDDTLIGGSGKDTIAKDTHDVPKTKELEQIRDLFFASFSPQLERFLLDLAATGGHLRTSGDVFDVTVDGTTGTVFGLPENLSLAGIEGPTSAVRNEQLSFQGLLNGQTAVAGVTDTWAMMDTHGVVIDSGTLAQWKVLDAEGRVVAVGAGASFNFAPTESGTYTVYFGMADGQGHASVQSAQLIVVDYQLRSDDTTPGALVLVIGGTTGQDKISVTRGKASDTISLTMYDQDKKCSNSRVEFTGVTRIVVYAGAGDDQVTVDKKVNISSELHGGAGRDTLSGGSGSDLLFGEASEDTLDGNDGNDVLVGGLGEDKIDGGSGDDILIGGLGQDDLDADYGSDILIAGYTTWDNDAAGLNDILAIWLGNATFAARTLQLRGTLLDAGHVFDDNASDRLDGGKDTDWILADFDGTGADDDSLYDKKHQDQIELI